VIVPLRTFYELTWLCWLVLALLLSLGLLLAVAALDLAFSLARPIAGLYDRMNFIRYDHHTFILSYWLQVLRAFIDVF
jgi:hypothetical protein